ncbi:amidase [Sulfolobus tengchongensis]|uniref:Amidase n=1 Tax=Sulfolobus tengchongensis TaxID=207809 RepID=A0AAX4KYK7_9CREN
MNIKLPTLDELRQISKYFNLDLDDEELKKFLSLAIVQLKSYERLDSLPDYNLGSKYQRTQGRPPTREENPYGALAWITSIKGRDEGKLKGKRICIKDNIMVAGIPMLNGSRMLEGFVPNMDATVVSRILDEGGEIVAKTTCEDLCFSGGSHTSYPWPVLNPRNPEYMAGGSSSGSAAAVASGYCDMAVGGDQGGSIRIPSSWVGIFGLKPTYGLVPYTGAFSIEPTLDHLGPMANTVKDLALLLEVIAGRDGLDPRQPDTLPPPPVKPYSKLIEGEVKGMSIGIVKEGFGWPNSEKDVDEVVLSSIKKFEELGVKVEEVSIPLHRLGLDIWTPIGIEGATATMILGSGLGWGRKGLFETQIAEFFGNSLKSRARDLPNTVKGVLLLGYFMITRYNNKYYAKARNLALLLKQAYDEALRRYDALAMPTTPMKAMKYKSEPSFEEYFMMSLGMINNTAPFDVTGHPAINIPVGYSNGLPVGLMLIGRHFEEDKVLKLAYAFEQSKH